MSSHPDKLARLVIIEGKDNRDKGKIFNLKKSSIIIGRGQADIKLNDLQVSRAHVALEFNEETGELQFTDLGSTNGVLVNGELRKGGTLKDRDRLKVGNTVFDCQLEFEGQTEIGTSSHLKLDSSSLNSASVSLKGPSALSSESDAKLNGNLEANLKEVKNKSASKNSSSEKAEKPFAASPTLSEHKAFIHKIPKSARVGGIALVLIVLVLNFLPSHPTRNLSNRSLEKYVSEIGKNIAEKNLEQAKTLALEAVKAFPSHSVPQVLLGNVYFELRKIDLSIEAYQKSLKFNPPQLITYTRLIRIYMLLDKREEAKNLLKQYLPLLEQGEPSERLYVQTGELFLDYPELEENKEAALVRAKNLQSKFAPSDPIGYKLESNIISIYEKSPESIKQSEILLAKGLELAPKDEWIYDRIFYLKLAQKDGPEAIKTLDSWIKATPKSTKPLILFAYLKFNEKNYLGAVPYLQKILNLLAQEPTHPHRAEALNLMGQISIDQNQLAEAENFFRQSCQAGYQPSCTHPILTGLPTKPEQHSSTTPKQKRQPSSTHVKEDRSPKKK